MPHPHTPTDAPTGPPHEHEHEHQHGQAHDHPHHGHGHGLLAAGAQGRVFAGAIALNLGFVVIEAGVGWWGSSLALLADAGHNLGDVAGLLVAWIGLALARRQADARRSYGLRRASILASLINAVLLLLAMSGLAWEAGARLLGGVGAAAGGAGHGLGRPDLVMAVAATGVLVNGATAWLFSRNEGDLNLRGAFLHMAGDALVSLGVVVSGALTLWQGWWWLDALTSLLITLVILVASWSLFGASLHLMVDGVPAGIDLTAVRQRLQGLPGVAAVHDLHVWALASSENALTAHLVRSEPADHAGVAFADGPGASGDEAGASDLLERAHATLREHYGIQHATLQIETTQQAARCAQRGACGLS